MEEEDCDFLSLFFDRKNVERNHPLSGGRRGGWDAQKMLRVEGGDNFFGVCWGGGYPFIPFSP